MNGRPTTVIVAALAVTGAIVALYALLALLSTLLTWPQIGLPQVWLPAGLAAAAIAIVGPRRGAPGIWLGAFLSLLALNPDTRPRPESLAITAAIAAGAVAQALIAGRLQRRYSAFWDPTAPRGAALAAATLKVALAATVAGMVDATIGTAVLAVAGQGGNLGLVWGIAWLGNTLGILLVAPPLLAISARLLAIARPRQFGFTAIGVGLILSTGVCLSLWSMESSRITQAFLNDAATAALALRSTADLHQHDVEMIHALYAASSEGVNREEFRAFVQLHMHGTASRPGLQALAWAPVVPGPERAAFEAAMRREGFADFTISERGPDGRLVRAGERSEYVVARYNEPFEANQAALGFDFGSDPIRRAALEQARDTGAPAATAPTRLLSDDTPGFLIFWPIYAPGASSHDLAGRRAAVTGYVIGVFRTPELVAVAMQAPMFALIDLYLFDEDPSAGAQLIFARATTPLGEMPGTLDHSGIARLQSGLHYSTTLTVAGRHWHMIARPAPAFVAGQRTWLPWGALVVGLAISGWISRALALRHQGAEALQRSEGRFRNLIEKSPSPVLLLDAEGRLLYSSPNYEHIMGRWPDSRIGTSALAVVHPDDRPEIAALLGEVIRSPGESRTGIFRAQHSDGSWRWIESTGTNLLHDPAVGAVVINLRDLTDYMQAEAALRASEIWLRTIFQTAQDGFWVVDRHQRFIDVNEAYCVMSGYSRAEILALHISDIDALEQPEETDARVRRLLTDGSDSFETRHRRKNGSLFDVEVSVHYIDHDGGQMVCFCRDITERKRRDEEIRRLNGELELRVAERTADLSRVNAELYRALRAKDEFLATMSHELRTPLNSILAFSELLMEQHAGPLNERQLRSLQHVDSSGRHLLSLINDILDLSKIEAGHMDLHPELHGLGELSELSMHFVKELAAKKGLRMSFTCNDSLTMIEVDAKRLKQMLTNLLSNAVKFTPAGGQVRFEVTTDAEQGVVRFVVEDSGLGIAPEDMGRLFKPFTQLDSSLARSHEGTGLGLALVKRLADLLGGSVHVFSAGLGQGSRFTLALPWQRRTLEQPAAPPAQISAGTTRTAAGLTALAGRVILLAEDNEATLSLISDFLQDRHYRVLVARNGKEAVERAVESTPDLILMDVQMPVLDGMEATRQLRAVPTFAATPIIALTALAMPGDRERCLAAGATDYLSKPVSLSGLAQLINALLARA